MERWLVDMRQEYNRDMQAEAILKWTLLALVTVSIVVLLLVHQ